jgi:hypothetical protein
MADENIILICYIIPSDNTSIARPGYNIDSRSISPGIEWQIQFYISFSVSKPIP